MRNRGDRRGLNPRQLEPQGRSRAKKKSNSKWVPSDDEPPDARNSPGGDGQSVPGTDIRECEDCGEEAPVRGPGRLRACSHCGERVCPWCDHHVHAMGRWKARQESHAVYALPDLEGVETSLLWRVAREAHVALATVMAVAGGWTRSSSGKALPVGKVRTAARAVARGA